MMLKNRTSQNCVKKKFGEQRVFFRYFGLYRSSEGKQYIVGELFECGSLLDYMRVSPYDSLHFTNAEVLKIFRILAGGLLFLHQDKELIHGDLALR